MRRRTGGRLNERMCERMMIFVFNLPNEEISTLLPTICYRQPLDKEIVEKQRQLSEREINHRSRVNVWVVQPCRVGLESHKISNKLPPTKMIGNNPPLIVTQNPTKIANQNGKWPNCGTQPSSFSVRPSSTRSNPATTRNNPVVSLTKDFDLHLISSLLFHIHSLFL